jgi:hypothetical protein
MASGQTLAIFHPYDNELYPSNGTTSFNAPIGFRNQQPYISLPKTSDFFATFSGVMPSWYAGGGITLYIWGVTASLTSGNLTMGLQLERRTTDADADSFTTIFETTVTAVSGTSGIPFVVDDNRSNGAEMDSIVAGDPFRLRLARYPLLVNDTVADAFQIIAVEIKEQ